MKDRPGDIPGAPGGTTVYNSYKNSTVDHSSHIHGHHISNTHHHYHGHRSIEGPLDRLEKCVSKGAAHDSAERATNAPKCFPETRQTVQGEVLSFVEPGGKERMLWLTGPAGAGKTAIIGSITDECHARGWLAATFFFSMSANKIDQCSKRYLIPTLVYQLFHLKIPGLPEAILASIDANPSVFDKRLEQQVEILLLRPIREVLRTSDSSTWPRVVIVDGVDDCDAAEGCEFLTKHDRRRSKEDNYREVLAALTQATQDPAFPFRIIIASRPESAIQGYFSTLRTDTVKKVILDSAYNPKADIELYLRSMLTKIGRDFSLPEHWYNQVVPQDWPGNRSRDIPCYLAEEASEQFVHAATVVRFVQDKSDTPPKQLDRVLNCRATRSCTEPFAALDALYTRILNTSPQPCSAALFIRASQFMAPAGTVGWMIQTLLESSPGEAENLLCPLTSLIGLQGGGEQPDFRLYHKSFIDFLSDPGRSGDLHVSGQRMWSFVSGRCYDVLKTTAAGQRIPLPANQTLDQFLPWFCEFLPSHLPTDRDHKYDKTDVDWWLSNLGRDGATFKLCPASVFGRVHMECRWYACLPACKVWRRGILRYAKANGWRVPSMLEMLRNRINPWCFDVDSLGP